MNIEIKLTGPPGCGKTQVMDKIKDLLSQEGFGNAFEVDHIVHMEKKPKSKFEKLVDSFPDATDTDYKMFYIEHDSSPYYLRDGIFKIAKYFFEHGQSAGPD